MKLPSLFTFNVLALAFLTLASALTLSNAGLSLEAIENRMDKAQVMPIQARDASATFTPTGGVVIAYTATEIKTFPIADVSRPVEAVGVIASSVNKAFPPSGPKCEVLFIPFSESVYHKITGEGGFTGTVNYYVKPTKVDSCTSLIGMGLQPNEKIEFKTPTHGQVHFTVSKGTYVLCARK
jgi:hypothetical protein